MTRFLLAAALFGLMSASCAEAIDDPQPGPDPATKSSPGVAQPFSADLPDTAKPDPVKIGTGLATPREPLTYWNPNPGVGIAGDKLSGDELSGDQLKVNLEKTVEQKTLDVQVIQVVSFE